MNTRSLLALSSCVILHTALFGAAGSEQPYITAKLAQEVSSFDAAAFHPHTSIIAAAHDAKIHFLNANNDPVQILDIPNLPRQTGFVTRMSFSPDGRLLAAQTNQETILVWDTETHEKPVEHFMYELKAFTFSPDSRYITALSEIGMEKIDAYSGALIAEKRWGHLEKSYTKIKQSLQGLLALMNTGQKEIPLYTDAAFDEPVLRIFTRHMCSLTSIEFSRDGKLLASSDERGKINVWDTDMESNADKITQSKFGGAPYMSKPIAQIDIQGKQIAQIGKHNNHKVFDLQFGQNALLFCATNDAIYGYNAVTGEQLLMLDFGKGCDRVFPAVKSLTCGSDNKLACIVKKDNIPCHLFIAPHHPAYTQPALSDDTQGEELKGPSAKKKQRTE